MVNSPSNEDISGNFLHVADAGPDAAAAAGYQACYAAHCNIIPVIVTGESMPFTRL